MPSFKKFIYISHLRYPSITTHSNFAVRTCEAFSQKGVDIELWIPKRNNFGLKYVDITSYYSIQALFPVKRLAVLDLTQIFPGKWPFFLMVITFNFSIFFYALYRGFLKQALFYIHDIRDIIILSFFKPLLIFENHDYFESKILFLNKMIFPKIHSFIATNLYKVKLLQSKYNIPKSKILHQPNAVDLAKFDLNLSREEARKKLLLPLDKKLGVYTGSLFSWKGVGTLFEAAKLFQEKKSQISNLKSQNTLFIFVGGAEKDIEKFRGEVKDFKNVEIVGRKPMSEIPLWLKAADILVLPNSAKSRESKYETSPVKLFEYMASGIPIVASDLPSIRNIVDERHLTFFEADKPKDLAQKITIVLAGGSEIENKAKASQREVQKYSWQERSANILDFLNSLDI